MANQSAYRLPFGSTAVGAATSTAEALRLSRDVLDRLAADGRLRIVPLVADQLVM
ncbi:hypothetical protein [Salinibacterium sp. PAMC 21357]|uniref:hypothetical protein n=1 Tax=Salinibacterium sp. PAMC 21357 TaxID=1112215 RepID=UPI001300C03E|nr:hypothetical protein [Salinibacterium sp. PAMC 21357]